MKKNIAVVVSLTIFCSFWSCGEKKNLNLSQNKVVETLTNYGAQNKETEIVLQTEIGEVNIRLYEETPLHRANFVRLVKEKYFDNAFFYRLVDGFLAQGGNNPNNHRPTFTIPMELSEQRFHKRGALAMASDKPTQFSSSTEFYIISGKKYSDEGLKELKEFGKKFTPEQENIYKTDGGYDPLDGKYTVFGEVTSGMDIIDKIAKGKTYNTDQSQEKIKFTIKIK
jgi:cyclophilin family peptidyl-prolyl cis-trans isomerase